MPKTNEEIIQIVANISKEINNNHLNALELVQVISTLLFSVGASLENYSDISAEKVLTNFAKNPTLGNALMAQALHMKETWVQNEGESINERTERNISGSTETT